MQDVQDLLPGSLIRSTDCVRLGETVEFSYNYAVFN